MFIIVLALILLTMWMLMKDERRKSKIKKLFIFEKTFPKTFDNSFDKTSSKSFDSFEQISIRQCEETLLDYVLEKEFTIEGSYKAEPNRILYHFGNLFDPKSFIDKYKANDKDNFSIKVIEDIKDLPNLDSNIESLIMFFTRNFIEKYDIKDMIIRYQPSTFGVPMLMTSDQTLSGELFYRPHDDEKYFEVIYTRNPKLTSDISFQSFNKSLIGKLNI